MAMEINGNYSRYGTDYEEQLRAKRQERAEEAQEEKEREAQKDTGRIPFPKDEYISSESAGDKPSGLYRLGQDERGNPKVLYDDPKKPARKKSVENEPSKEESVKRDPAERESAEKESVEKKSADKMSVDAAQDENPKASGEKCVTDTDRVDQEIRKLKEERKQLQQQIKASAADEEKVSRLQAMLAQVENELGQKDNDTYRKQNAVVSNV